MNSESKMERGQETRGRKITRMVAVVSYEIVITDSGGRLKGLGKNSSEFRE